MYSRVQREECIACGLCQLRAPALFNYDKEGIAYYR
ncbi:MAG: ferredoxin, partial [Loigolactobacillus coryniformis]